MKQAKLWERFLVNINGIECEQRESGKEKSESATELKSLPSFLLRCITVPICFFL